MQNGKILRSKGCCTRTPLPEASYLQTFNGSNESIWDGLSGSSPNSQTPNPKP